MVKGHNVLTVMPLVTLGLGRLRLLPLWTCLITKMSDFPLPPAKCVEIFNASAKVQPPADLTLYPPKRRRRAGFKRSRGVTPYVPVNITIPTYVKNVDVDVLPTTLAFGADGVTTLRKYQPKAFRGSGGKFGGFYTLRRSRPKIAKALAICNALFERTGYAYLLTFTSRPCIIESDVVSNWRKLVDNFRKMDGLVAYTWIAEEHTGYRDSKNMGECLDYAEACAMPSNTVYGALHYHAMIVTRDYWEYPGQALRWSMRYGRSRNAVDIEPIRTNGWYLLPYMAKSCASDLKRSHRLWGSSFLPKALDTNIPLSDWYGCGEFVSAHSPRTDLRPGLPVCIDGGIAAGYFADKILSTFDALNV